MENNCRDVVVLADMPDLFPTRELQSRLLEYVRSTVKVEDGKIQFIIVMSSPLLSDNATQEEFFKLVSPERLTEGSNQLLNVSDANV